MKKYIKFPDSLYEVVVKVDNNREAEDVVKKWAVIYKKDPVKNLKYLTINNYFPKYLYLISERFIDDIRVFSYDGGNYSEQKNYTPLSYKEFLNIFFYKPSRHLKQLNFESYLNEMFVPKFKVGDKVVRIDPTLQFYKKEAIVRGYNSNLVIIEFYEKIGDKDTDYRGLTKLGYGWSCREKTIEKVKSKSKYVKQLNFESLNEVREPGQGHNSYTYEWIVEDKKVRIFVKLNNGFECKMIIGLGGRDEVFKNQNYIGIKDINLDVENKKKYHGFYSQCENPKTRDEVIEMFYDIRINLFNGLEYKKTDDNWNISIFKCYIEANNK